MLAQTLARGGKMPKVKIRSAAHVLNLPAPTEGRLSYFDKAKGAPKGFCVRVTSTGARAYYVTYRKAGRFVWFKVGAPPLGLTQAREKAKDLLAQVQLAKTGLAPDPVKEREAKRQEEERVVSTFAALCSAFVDDRERSLAASSSAEYRRMIVAYIEKHRVGRTPAADVTSLDLKARLTEMVATAPVQANRVFSFLRAVCRWAKKLGTLDDNPMDRVDRPAKETSRERVLSDDEVSCLWAATENEKPTVKAAVRLLALLGQRTGETLEGLRWDGLDLDADIPVWTIPGTFRKGKRLHTVPLPKVAVKMIENLRPITGTSERVLDVMERNSEVMWWGRVRDRALDVALEREVKMEHFTKHDLRRTATTGMRRLGVSPHIAELVIGHVVGSEVSRVYDRYAALPERASALQTWAAHVEKVTSGEKHRADVLPMAGRA